MITIQFPVSKLSYSVTADSIIETHLFDKFFPYARFDNAKMSRAEEPTIFINYKSKILEVEYGAQLHKFEVNTRKDAYIKIIEIIRDHIVFYDNMIALHGATIDYFGKRFVFLAPSGTGKSVLTAFLSTKPDFVCCSDDVIYIDCANYTSVAYSKYIYLRPSAENIHTLDRGLFKNYDDFVSRFQVHLSPTDIETKRKIERFVILSRENVEMSYITKCNEPFNALLYNLFFTHQIRHSFRMVANLSTKISVDILHYNDLENVHLFLRDYFKT